MKPQRLLTFKTRFPCVYRAHAMLDVPKFFILSNSVVLLKLKLQSGLDFSHQIWALLAKLSKKHFHSLRFSAALLKLKLQSGLEFSLQIWAALTKLSKKYFHSLRF